MHGRLSALLIPLALAGCATAARSSADEVSRARVVDRQVAGGSSIPVMPPEKGATDCFGHSEPQAVCDSPARSEQAGFGGHRVDDNVNPPPGAHED